MIGVGTRDGSVVGEIEHGLLILGEIEFVVELDALLDKVAEHFSLLAWRSRRRGSSPS